MDKAFLDDESELSLYHSDARQVIFKLEGLCRLYKKIYDKKYFKSLQNEFKSLEDQLGKIDFYDGYWQEFSAIKDFPIQLLNSIKQDYFNELNTLKELIQTNDWKNPNQKFESIIEKIEGIEWLQDDQERLAVAKVVAKQVSKIKEKYKSGELNFNDIELGLHEFRRKIRWISIYAIALDGLIQLQKDDYNQFLKKYLTKEVLKNKFNHLPAIKKDIKPIYLSQSAFYALSWLISESGKMKDHGLKLVLIDELQKISGEDDKIVLEKLMISFSKEKPSGLNEIIDKIKFEADHFIYTDKVLDILMKDLNSVND
ncbi:MAG: hypothetical protein KKB15_14175 [Bacteroidetes bacterium]|nr:hypothetical protein [Bacteroidota bacterium]